MSQQDLRDLIASQEHGTYCIVGIWIYIKLDGGYWYEPVVEEWGTDNQLAEIIENMSKDGSSWVLY